LRQIHLELPMPTDSHGERSRTAGRAACITGQNACRTGLSSVSIPAAPIGMRRGGLHEQSS
jgi:hypothetical protein